MIKEGDRVWLKPFTVEMGASEEQPRQQGTVLAVEAGNSMVVVQVDDEYLDLDSPYGDDGLRECSIDQVEGF